MITFLLLYLGPSVEGPFFDRPGWRTKCVLWECAEIAESHLLQLAIPRFLKIEPKLENRRLRTYLSETDSFVMRRPDSARHFLSSNGVCNAARSEFFEEEMQML